MQAENQKKIRKSRKTRKGRIPTMRDLHDLFLQEKGIIPERFDQILSRMVLHFGGTKWRELDDSFLNAYWDGLGLGPGTRRLEALALRRAISIARQTCRILPTDPTPFTLPEAPPPKDVWMTKSQAEALCLTFQRMGRDRGFPLPVEIWFRIACSTGGRLKAILDMRWEQIDFVRGRIDLQQPGKPLTNKRNATVPLEENLAKWIQERLIDKGWKDSPWVCGFRRAGFRDQWERGVGLTPGLPEGLTPHSVRHSVCVWLCESGFDLLTVAQFLGDRVATIERVYAHHNPDRLRKAAGALNFLGGSSEIPLTYRSFNT